MDTRRQGLARQLVPFLAVAGVSAALWAGWLGWDQERDVHPDGSTTGPYEAWQVVGLGVCLLALVWWGTRYGTRRGWRAEIALGVSAGLTGAAFLDWSDDASGLFMVGVVMVAAGSLAATTLVSVIVRSHFSDPSC
ncbi:hypothetical protein ABZX85_01620 [Streptomyces sp. NPDC004539]|uniref:hypothetical protein n=1 Tax=Streptomyces sp. NPDC004539 TaxID=3154280 RepID=UPI0033B0057D